PAQGEQLLSGFVAREPDNLDLRLAWGALQERRNEIQEAQATYAEVIRRAEKEPKGLIARDRIARIAFDQGRYDDAQQLIGEVLRKNARDVDALVLRGRMALAHNDTSAAITDFRTVLKDQPKAVVVQRLLAQALEANGEAALAEETLRSAMDTAPADMGVRTDLASLLMQARRFEEATSLMEETVRKAPQDLAARELLTRAYLLKRDFANARTSAGDVRSLRPDLAIGWYLAGLAAEGENHLDDAQKSFERALQIQPGAFDALS